MNIVEEQIMWFPGIYGGRETEEYTQSMIALDIDTIYELVEKRVSEDGEWLIANDRVGPNNESEPKMRRMMAFASDRKNILQAVDAAILDNVPRSVDYICRELANASKWAANIKQ